MASIEIFLSIRDEAPVSPVSFLLIPLSDIERLANFPFRWIRYVMFAICGARGDLYTTPNATPDDPHVDYDRTELVDTEITYYYRPSEECAFVDHQGLSDRLTSTARTPRGHYFRENVIRRDGPACVITQTEETACDAIHLIPRSKGDEYIARVIELRSPGGNSEPPSNAGIDDITNGILVSRNLHAYQGIGEVAFIKTPNYGLRPEDIKRFQRGDPRPEYLTLQRLKRPKGYNPESLAALQTHYTGGLARDLLAHPYTLGANVDAHFQGDGDSLPSTVILDYVYGVAAYKCWRSNRDGVLEVMQKYREEHYKDIPPIRRSLPDDTEEGDTSTPVLDDPNDQTYKPPPKRFKARRDESDLSRAMDELNMVLMYVTRGITPEEAAERRQKEIELEERAAQEASRSKVMEWRDHMDVH